MSVLLYGPPCFPRTTHCKRKIVKEKEDSLGDTIPRNLLRFLLHAWLQSKPVSFHHYLHKRNIGIVTAKST